MIDRGLLLTLAVIVVSLVLAMRIWPPRTVDRSTMLDLATSVGVLGVVVGRLFFMALEDPSGLTRIGDILIVRSGMEFWAGAFAASAYLVWTARRRELSLWPLLADMAPYALIAYAVFEASCLVRGGCPGPASDIGLYPQGFANRIFPVGVAVALAILAWVPVARRLARNRPRTAVTATVAVVAGLRAVASIWLPKVGNALTRQHRTSIAVAVAALVATAWFASREMRSAEPVSI
ncbi:MAG TPA: hypothetical protein ENI86_03540 [Acidimicrobiales bacterium]|nr:hypothetical protein [Acidimicrobiales bacterium]